MEVSNALVCSKLICSFWSQRNKFAYLAMHVIHTPFAYLYRATSSGRGLSLPRHQWNPPVETSGRWSMRESVVWLWCCQTWWRMERLEELKFKGCTCCCSSTIISLQEVCYQYWPSDDTKGVQKYGEFNVSVLQTTKQEDGSIQRNISITNPKVWGKYEGN